MCSMGERGGTWSPSREQIIALLLARSVTSASYFNCSMLICKMGALLFSALFRGLHE